MLTEQRKKEKKTDRSVDRVAVQLKQCRHISQLWMWSGLPIFDAGDRIDYTGQQPYHHHTTLPPTATGGPPARQPANANLSLSHQTKSKHI